MQVLQNTKVRIKNEQSRETDNDTQDEKNPKKTDNTSNTVTSSPVKVFT